MINEYALSSEVIEKSNYISKYSSLLNKLENLGSNLTLLPDFNEKAVGFPSGLVINNDSYIFPSSVPDIGDGYRIVLTNLHENEINSEQKNQILRSLYREGSLESSSRIKRTSKLDIRQVFSKGNKYLAEISDDQSLSDPASWQAKTEDFNSLVNVSIPPEDLKRYQVSFGVFGSPFLEMRSIHHLHENTLTKTVGLFNGQVIIIIHVGTLIGKKILREQFLEPAVKYTLAHLRLSESDILDGIFVLPANHEIGKKFLSYASMLTNYSKANRGYVYYQIKQIMKSIMGSSFTCSILSDIPHSKFEVTGNRIVSARGVQKLYPHGNPMASNKNIGDISVIGGGTFGDSLLVIAGKNASFVDYNCSHGSGIFRNANNVPPKNFKKRTVFTRKIESRKGAYTDFLNSEISFKSLIRNGVVTKIACLKPMINFWEE